MFRKIARTTAPPTGKPLMVWDGQCPFCRYWITVLKSKTGGRVEYQPYQTASARFPDLSDEDFREAVRLIEPDGTVYSGPDCAYRSFLYFSKPIAFPHRLYGKSSLFISLSDWGYYFVSENRPFMLALTKLMWGTDPLNRKPYWLIYLIAILVPVLFLVF